ncbi:sensor domain-containing diguanylate cyclase [Pseudooceanicola sp. CBS1P-1]|nr:sensor domain-containing diguanylate cyclase [Pseudooceanicola endophyticus]MBT9384887.1 sensor domain-containing diguanylate cyclase [Pseudooceanicola endophyticus]
MSEKGRLAALERKAVLDTPHEEPFDRIAEIARLVLKVPMANVGLVDAQRHWLKAASGISLSEIPREASFGNHTIQSECPLVVPDTLADPRFRDLPPVRDLGVRAYLGVPLHTSEGFNIGALSAFDVKPRAFTPEDVAIMRHLAALVMNEFELREIAAKDGLTGAMTRRSWIEGVRQEIERCRRYDIAGSLVMMDIDHFKKVNDTYGHPVGDAVLRSIGEVCLTELRNADLFGRVGGEEFAIFLPHTDADHARICAERLRTRIDGTFFRAAGARLHVTASFGICALGNDIASVEHWLHRADAALYRAKRDGRNLCCVA